MAAKEELEEVENVEEEAVPNPDDLTTYDLEPADQVPLDVRDIGLDDIYELPNIRPAYHGIEGLAETMYIEGQLQPCLVRPAPPEASHGKPFELVFGYRRKRAIEFLKNEKELEGYETLRCEVREINNDRELSKMIVENMQRESLSPVAEANAMKALKESNDPPLTNVEIARRLGCDPSHVSHRLSMVAKLAIPPVAPKQALEPAGEQEEAGEDEEGGEDSVITVADGASLEEKPMEKIKEDSEPDSEVEVEEEEPEEKHLDILELVDSGKISASVAEVIASLEDRADQEKLAKLVVSNDWGVKRAAKWVRGIQEHKLDEGGEEMGDIEMAQMEDAVELPKLELKSDISGEELRKANLYALLRNGMDQEILIYLNDKMDTPYENLWDYVRNLSDTDTNKLIDRYILRYLTAAHRYHSLEASLIDDLSNPHENAEIQSIPSADEALFDIEGEEYE